MSNLIWFAILNGHEVPQRISWGGEVEDRAGRHLVPRAQWLGADSGHGNRSVQRPGAFSRENRQDLVMEWMLGVREVEAAGMGLTSLSWRTRAPNLKHRWGVVWRISKLEFRSFKLEIFSKRSTDDRQAFGFEYNINSLFPDYGLILLSSFYWVLVCSHSVPLACAISFKLSAACRNGQLVRVSGYQWAQNVVLSQNQSWSKDNRVFFSLQAIPWKHTCFGWLSTASPAPSKVSSLGAVQCPYYHSPCWGPAANLASHQNPELPFPGQVLLQPGSLPCNGATSLPN